MRLPWRKKPAEVEESQRIVADSEALRQKVSENWGEISERVRNHQEILARNHLAQAVNKAFRGTA